MKTKKEERVRKLLSEAHRAKETLKTEGLWRSQLMARIRETDREGIRSCPSSTATGFEQFVWRLFPATLTMSAGLAVFLGWLYVTTEYNGLQLFVYYVETLTMQHIFGV